MHVNLVDETPIHVLVTSYSLDRECDVRIGKTLLLRLVPIRFARRAREAHGWMS
jgi:hypothetical protein